MKTKFVVSRNGIEIGQFSKDGLVQMAHDGKLKPTDYVRRTDRNKAILAGRIHGLIPISANHTDASIRKTARDCLPNVNVPFASSDRTALSSPLHPSHTNAKQFLGWVFSRLLFANWKMVSLSFLFMAITLFGVITAGILNHRKPQNESTVVTSRRAKAQSEPVGQKKSQIAIKTDWLGLKSISANESAANFLRKQSPTDVMVFIPAHWVGVITLQSQDAKLLGSKTQDTKIACPRAHSDFHSLTWHSLPFPPNRILVTSTYQSKHEMVSGMSMIFSTMSLIFQPSSVMS